MELLRRRMNDLQTRLTNGHMPTDRVIDIGATMHDEITEEDASDDMIQNFVNLHSVWTIIFTNAVDGSEGVYSLAIGSENVILAFEDRQEAQRYALCLEAQTFPSPKISELETSELCDFCTDSGSRLGFVPAGSLITPPDESAVEDLDKWRGKSSGNDTGMSQEDIENMKKRLDSLFGQ